MLCIREGGKWVGAAYFPRGKKTEGAVRKKFSADLQGVKNNQAQGLAFVTNQELSLSTRQELVNVAGDTTIELYHLERLSAILDSPSCYGIRLEFLDIEMTKEEQIAFMAAHDRVIEGIQEGMARIESAVSNKERHSPRYVTPKLTLKMASLAAIEPQLHSCSHCGYGYFVNRSFGLLYGSWGEMTVTCPGCGNSEKWKTP